VRSAAGRLGAKKVADDLAALVGQTGTAHPALLLSHTLEQAAPGQVIALVSLADGVDVAVLRTTEALAAFRPARPVATQLATAATCRQKYLAWQRIVTIEPPAGPARPHLSGGGYTDG
jgi:3-hydroxy-3-methylglutaryl CoA synthase